MGEAQPTPIPNQPLPNTKKPGKFTKGLGTGNPKGEPKVDKSKDDTPKGDQKKDTSKAPPKDYVCNLCKATGDHYFSKCPKFVKKAVPGKGKPGKDSE